MALPPLDEKTKQAVLAEIGLNKDSLKEAVRVLKEWLEQQPHLPSECEDYRLEHWIISCKNSLERTKACLDMYYSFKNIMPDILTERDLAGDWFENITSTVFVVPLPSLTQEYSRVIIVGPVHQDPSKFNMTDFCKLGLLFHDVKRCEDACLSSVYIADLTNFSTGFLAKFTIPMAKKAMEYHKNSFREQITSIHIIGSPKYMEFIMGIAKVIFSPKLFGRIHIHSKGNETLYEYVPKKILPNEYGGDAGPFAEMQSSWNKHLKTYRRWLLDQDKFKSDESKRIGTRINSEEIFGFDGSFRQLSID